METKLNIFLFFALLLVLGINYTIKSDNKAIERKDKAKAFVEQSSQQVDSLEILTKTITFSQYDTTKVSSIINQK